MSTFESSKEDGGISVDVQRRLKRAIEYWTPERVEKAVTFNDELDVGSNVDDKSPVLKTEPTFGGKTSQLSSLALPLPPPPDPAALNLAALDHAPALARPLQRLRVSARQYIVDATKLQDRPYQSVGKVYATLIRKGCSEEVDMKVTAFYIGQQTQLKGYGEHRIDRLLTVAHVFDSEEFSGAEHMIFAPASNPGLSNKTDIFLVIDKYLHPQYKSGTATNDVCVLFVWPWPGNNTPIYEALSPLKLAVKDYFGPKDGWKIIGYPSGVDNQPAELPALSVPQMEIPPLLEMPGKYTPHYKVKHKVELGLMTILASKQAEPGMSGGPWIHQHKIDDEFVVNGIQAHICFSNSVSLSPHFTNEMLEALDLQVHYVLDEGEDYTC